MSIVRRNVETLVIAIVAAVLWAGVPLAASATGCEAEVEASASASGEKVVRAEVVCSEGGRHTVTVDGSVKKEEQNGGTGYQLEPFAHTSDYDDDGEVDGSTSTPGGVWCPPEDERGVVTGPACPILDAATEGS